MQSIITRYQPATGRRGARVTARATGGHSVSIPYDPGLSDEEAHHAAAVALGRKLGWTGRLVSGGLGRGGGNIYVFLPRDPREIVDIERWAPRRGDPRRRR